MRSLCTVVLLTLLGACKPEPEPFATDLHLGGALVPATTLNHGARFYRLHCAGCHGAKGDGKGEVAPTQIPRPRDLRLGTIKFASVRAGELPTDADLERLLRRGLNGTGMQPWRFRDAEVQALVAYVKTLSPRWANESPGDPVVAAADPWQGRTEAARQAGEALFFGAGRCSQCHAMDDGRPPATPQTPSLYGPLTAPDLRTGVLRAGDAPEDLYRVIAAGVGGTQMTATVDSLQNADIWALVHYLKAKLQS